MNVFNHVLIVPCGIEMFTPLADAGGVDVLIVPCGIEIWLRIDLADHCLVLIVPCGIEIRIKSLTGVLYTSS